ncbi:hypothetical protein D9758_003880 [Tetrapyrgos nigripes]|uniref:C2H2-type domain-containing protein n=1 Tax=Tetrapyrgos nigripes TaxID=182062 RepID=A0A8H5LRT6_9AGAR|nr:hypothetical protein D9758_003880 [Tetrapyrgos nigripes]
MYLSTNVQDSFPTPASIMAYNPTLDDEQLYDASAAGWSPARQQANIQHDVCQQYGFTPPTTVHPFNPSAGQAQSHLSVQMHSQKPNDGWASGHHLPANAFIAPNSNFQQHSAYVPDMYSPSTPFESASEKYNSDHYGYHQNAQSSALPESQMYTFPPHSSVGMNHVASGPDVAFLSPWDSPTTDSTVSPLALTAEFGGTAAAYPMMPHEISKHRVATDAVERAARMKRRSTNKLVKCTVPGCPQTFTAKHNLSFHLQSHRGVKVQCSQCGNEFAPTSLKRHQDRSCPGRRRI